MLKVYVGVVRFRDDRDFVIMVDGEPEPVEDAVREVIHEIWGAGEISVAAEGVDFIEFTHAHNGGRTRPDGYVVACEVSSRKRVGFAMQYARRERNLE